MATSGVDQEVLAVVRASFGRRALGVGSLAVLGFLLIYVALVRPPESLGWQGFLIILGGLTLWLAETMRRATALFIELTRDGLRCSDGEVIARIDEIQAMDRGMFAFKPSNGFLMTTKAKAPARWQPGLWWRLGRRIGIGGVTPGHQSKAMAEIIAALIAERA